MGIDADLRTRQPATVDDARVVPLVAQDQVTARDQGRDRAGVGGEAGRKEQCRLGPLEFSQSPFQQGVRFRASGYQGAGTAAPTGLAGRLIRGLRQARIGGQAEVVVGTEVDQRPSIDSDGRRLGGLAARQLPPQAAGVELGQFVVEPGEWVLPGGGLLVRIHGQRSEGYTGNYVQSA